MKRVWWVHLIGWLSLGGMAVLLTIYSIRETYVHHPVLSILKVMLLVGITFSIYREARVIGEPHVRTRFQLSDLYDFLGVIIGALVTFMLQTELGLHAVAASAVVGLAGGMFLKPVGAALFCGSFVGMASPGMFCFLPGVVLSSCIAALLFVITRELYPGIGGKLGTKAFFGCLAGSWILGFEGMADPVPGWDAGILILVCSVLGAVGTFLLHHRMSLGPVIASSLVGLVSVISLPLLFQDIGLMLAVITFCASFAGMASRIRFPSYWEIGIGGLLCGLLFIFTAPHLGGAGGKLGTIAFASLLGLLGWKHLAEYFRELIHSR